MFACLVQAVNTWSVTAPQPRKQNAHLAALATKMLVSSLLVDAQANKTPSVSVKLLTTHLLVSPWM
jgi:hypothetical protein